MTQLLPILLVWQMLTGWKHKQYYTVQASSLCIAYSYSEPAFNLSFCHIPAPMRQEELADILQLTPLRALSLLPSLPPSLFHCLCLSF